MSAEMSKLSKVSNILSQIQTSAPPTLPEAWITTPDAADEHPQSIAVAMAEATATASAILNEISFRWPAQAGRWAGNKDMVLAWGRGILESKIPSQRLRRALVDVGSRPFPPDLGALLDAASDQHSDAEEQFHAAARAAGCNPPAWHSLERRTYATALAMASAGWNLREVTWDRPGVRSAWGAAYKESCRREAAGVALPQPPDLVAAIPQKTDRAAFLAARGEVWGALGLTPPNR